MANIKDLTGQRFGQLVAICKTDKRIAKNVVWECKCDCGKTAYVAANALQNGNTQSCGCLRVEKIAVDLTGQRFGKLVAICKTDERKSGSVVWECKCDCGKTAYVAVQYLRSGKTRSCGCAKRGKKATDIAGQRFGKLVAICKTDERKSGSVVWECKCDCGKTTFVLATDLRAGRVKSCGCSKSAKA